MGQPYGFQALEGGDMAIAEEVLSTLATKKELDQLKGELRGMIDSNYTKLKTDITDLKSEFRELMDIQTKTLLEAIRPGPRENF